MNYLNLSQVLYFSFFILVQKCVQLKGIHGNTMNEVHSGLHGFKLAEFMFVTAMLLRVVVDFYVF